VHRTAARGAGFQLFDDLLDQRVGMGGRREQQGRQDGDGLDTAPACMSLVETSLSRARVFSKARQEGPSGRCSAYREGAGKKGGAQADAAA
jgi:hypothetical protein